MENKDLILEALKAREFAYAPYSHFKVGAALLAKNGRVYHGCNIENAGYTPSNCAERTAFFKAVSEGATEFEKIAIIAGKDKIEQYTAPCGVCRQVMMEFCKPEEFQVIMAKSTEDYKMMTLKELLPMGFGPDNLAE